MGIQNKPYMLARKARAPERKFNRVVRAYEGKRGSRSRGTAEPARV